MAKKKKTEAEVEVVDGDFVPETQPMVVSEDNFDMPSDEARKRAMDLRDKMKEEYVEMCRLLFHIQRKQMYSSWGYGTFDEYVAKELEFEKSKARHLIQIWECLYERQGDKTVFDKVINLGWTKASKLIHVVNAENVDNWVEKGTHMSVEGLVKEVKTWKDKKISDDPKEALETASEVEGTPMELAMKSMNLQLHHDDYLAVCQAVEMMQSIQPGVSVSQAIALIARDFMSSNPHNLNDPKATTVEFLKKFESTTDLRMVIIDFESKEILHGFNYLKDIADGSGEEVKEIEGENAFN